MTPLDQLFGLCTEPHTPATEDTSTDQFRSLFETMSTTVDETSGRAFRTSMLEAQAQIPSDDRVQTRVSEFDGTLGERIPDLVDGVDSGPFDDRVDTVGASEFLRSSIPGTHTRQLAIDHSSEVCTERRTHEVETQLAGPGSEGVAAR